MGETEEGEAEETVERKKGTKEERERKQQTVTKRWVGGKRMHWEGNSFGGFITIAHESLPRQRSHHGDHTILPRPCVRTRLRPLTSTPRAGLGCHGSEVNG